MEDEKIDPDAFEFVLMFNKATGSNRIFYFMVDPRNRSRMFPKMNTTYLQKLRDLVGYMPVVLNNCLYIIGGKFWESGEYSDATWRYDPCKNKWHPCGNLNEARCRFTVSALDGKIYITGGEIRGGKVTDSVEMYDPSTDTWTEIKSLPRPRVDHAGCAANGKLYVSGGISNLKHQCSNVFWMYDPQTDEWHEPASGIILPQEREKHAMVPVGDSKIYFLSGRGFDQEQFQEKEENAICSYNTNFNGNSRKSKCWDTDLPNLSTPRANAGCVELNGNIYLLGGKSYKNDCDVMPVWFYSTNKKRWRYAFTLPDGHSYVNVACVKLNIPQTNKEFNFSDLLLYDRWIMW